MIFTRNKIHVIREELYLENPHVQRSLEACSSWGHKELDTTDQVNTAHSTEKGKGDGERRGILRKQAKKQLLLKIQHEGDSYQF